MFYFFLSINENLDEFKAKAQECVEQSLKQFEEESVVTSGMRQSIFYYYNLKTH